MSELSSLELLAPNNILLFSPLIKLTKSVGSSGHPLLEQYPPHLDNCRPCLEHHHRQNLSMGILHLQHHQHIRTRSMLSATPSPSLSGQPFISADPASLGQASSASATPSPSLSGHP